MGDINFEQKTHLEVYGLATGFAVVIADMDGRVIDYSAPMNMSYSLLREAAKLGYDLFRMTFLITKELEYDPPRELSIKTDRYEIMVFNRGNRLVIAIFTEVIEPPQTYSVDEAVVNA